MTVGDSPADWPPPGWTEDVKITSGRKTKYYTHVETGKKFYSKKEVTRYMNTKDTCHDVAQVLNQDKSSTENNVSQMNHQDKSFSENNVSQMNYQDRSCSENNVSQIVEETKKSPEWLPAGWIVELKTRKSGSNAGLAYKVYIDPSTGNKFYSRPEVSKYLKTMKQNDITGEEQIHGTGEVSSSNQKASENSKDIGGLSRISKRQKSDGNRPSHDIKEGSFSKRKPSQDSEEVGEPSCISKTHKSGINRPSTKTSASHGAGEDSSLNEKASLNSKENGVQSPSSKRQKPGSDSPSAMTVCSVAVDCNSVDELPPGWKKEVIIRQTDRGIRKDPVYTDPVHGYKFRSKKEVFRYLQTGDTSKCARRHSKRNVASTMKDNSHTTDDASLKKSECFVTGRQLFATEEAKGENSFVTCSPAQQVESSKKLPDCSVSDPNIIITSILAEINENHSFEDVNEDAEIGTVSVGVETLSAVSTQSDLLPEQQLPENEQEKHNYKAGTQQSGKSRNPKSLKPGRRVSKRLAGREPEAATDLDLGEHALPAVVEKSASLNVCGQELLQHSDPTPETGNSDQASLSGEASVDELPPGWKKEIKVTKKARGIRKDPLYTDPVHGYVFRSKKDVLRYLQTGDISKCAIKPFKRDLDATMKESSPAAHNTSSKKLGCAMTERQPFAAEEARGEKRAVTYSPAVQAESSKKQRENSASNANTSITSAADINTKHSCENVIENAEMSLDTEPEIRDSNADTKVITAESVVAERLSAVSTPLSDLLPGQQLPENEQEKHINKETPKQSRRSRNKKSITPGRRISKRLVGHSPEPVANLDLGERAFRAVVKKSASLGIPLNDCCQELAQNEDLTVGTGNSDQASLSREASADELPPGFTWNKGPTGRTGNSDQASLSREASADELPPGFTWNNCPTVETGNSDQAFLSREASADELPPGWEKEILAQKKDPTVGTGNSYQSFLRREASVDELPPGWKKEIRIRQNARGIRKDPFYTDPVHGYVFRSKKDVMRYLQTGDISRCAMRPTKRDPDSEMKGNSPSTRGASSKKLGCSLSGRQPFSIEELKGGECFVTYSLALQAESSNEHPESSVFNNTISSSTVADTTEKHSCGNVNVDAEIRLDMERELRDSIGDTKAVAAESVDVKRSLAVSPQMDFFPELQLPENKKKKHSNKKLPAQSRKIRNEESFTPVRRVSKRLSGHYSEVVPDLNVGECGPGSVSSGHPLTVSGRELSQQADLATLDQAFLRKIALSQDDPLEIVKCPSEGQAFKEQKAAKELTSEKQDDRRILRDPQPAEISYEIGKVHLEHQVVKERPTAQDSQKRLLNNSWPAQLAWGNRVLPVENQYVSERCSVEQVSEKHDYENMQLRDSQLGESSQRSRELNVENQPVREKQTGELVTENQDEQSRRLQAQLASYPFGDYWSDPCMEFAFKTLTGAIPVEDTLAFQGSSQQEFNTSYTQADDGCFELPLFNTSSFYMNDVPSHCTPSEERVPLEQPPITQTFLPTGSNSMPGCSSVVSQSPGLDTQAKDYQSKVKSQCPGMDTQANKSNFFAHWK
uniref:Uncharacterized protein isoform X7 n=1 Tax=Nicotiana tabacum TaxID=4097 RepID=A0A1S3ZPW6_TOBAC|nr:PREDICTED: uncharacterized protein LOC107789161 isoform X7 [Nicotiana tabacum]